MKGSNRSQDLRTDEEKAQKQAILNNSAVPEENGYLSKKNNNFEEKSKKGKLTTEELNRLLLNIDPSEFEKPTFGEDDYDSEENYEPEVEPEVEPNTKPGYHQKLSQFECIEEVTESFEETSEEHLKNSSKAYLSSRASKSSAALEGLSGFKDVQVLQSSDRLHSESGSLHDRIAITKDQISALSDLEKQLEEDIITISSSKAMIYFRFISGSGRPFSISGGINLCIFRANFRAYYFIFARSVDFLNFSSLFDTKLCADLVCNTYFSQTNHLPPQNEYV